MSERSSWIVDVRARLATPPPRRLAPPRSDAAHAPDGARPAAVLVPLYVDANELWTVLTRRTEELPHHKGQIAFPGGACDLGEDAWTAALRESEEEIALPRAGVLRLGQLDELETPAGFRVVPCVGAVPFPLRLQENPAEIAEVFSVPLSAMANPSVIEERQVLLDGRARAIRTYHLGNRRVWGLTARVVQNLMVRLGLEALAEHEEIIDV